MVMPHIGASVPNLTQVRKLHLPWALCMLAWTQLLLFFSIPLLPDW
jgi:hypothetical protein